MIRLCKDVYLIRGILRWRNNPFATFSIEATVPPMHKSPHPFPTPELRPENALFNQNDSPAQPFSEPKWAKVRPCHQHKRIVSTADRCPADKKVIEIQPQAVKWPAHRLHGIGTMLNVEPSVYQMFASCVAANDFRVNVKVSTHVKELRGIRDCHLAWIVTSLLPMAIGTYHIPGPVRYRTLRGVDSGGHRDL